MDPLSVTASIVGILAAASKVGELLHGTISTAKDAPRVLVALACEVQEVRAALSSLQNLLSDLSLTQSHRAALIQIDQLIVTLTDSVLTFSELETAIAPFIALQGAKVPLRARLKWVWAEDSCNKIVDRLQRHKSTITLMLNILQCASDADANRSQSSLESMIDRLLQDNQRLGKRLRNLEDAFDAMSIVTRDMDNSSLAPEADSATITSTRPSASNRVSILEAVKVRFAFDEDLQSSRVYRTMQHRNCDHSIVSSVIRTQTWSIFSGLSLADISVISVIALPLYPEDVRDHSEYYQFGQTEPAEIAATWTNAQVIVETGTSGENNENLPGHKVSSSMESTPTSMYPLVLPEIPMTVLELDPPFELQNEGQGATSVKSPRVHDQTLQLLEGPPNLSPDISEENASSSKVAATEADSSLEKPPQISDAYDSWSDDGYRSPVPEDDVFYPCKGCGEILEEGKAFELAGNRWHLDCFRCNTCGDVLDADSNLLLLGDGSLICNKCTYSCDHCGEKIEDLAILTGDQAFCAKCFSCRNCKRKIENLRYARTSQGIFCMACHESLMARRRKKERMKELPPLPANYPPEDIERNNIANWI